MTDRQAVSQCASAVMSQAAAQYGNRYNPGYGNNGYGHAYNGAMRVTSITDVQRRNNGLRVSGTMSSGERFSGQYANHAYAGGDVRFRCNVDYRGAGHQHPYRAQHRLSRLTRPNPGRAVIDPRRRCSLSTTFQTLAERLILTRFGH